MRFLFQEMTHILTKLSQENPDTEEIYKERLIWCKEIFMDFLKLQIQDTHIFPKFHKVILKVSCMRVLSARGRF